MVDGDKALIIQDRTLCAVAKRNMKDIVPLAYELRKAKGGTLTPQSLYDGMACAYTGGNIGPVSNNITKVWNSGQIGEEQINVVKWLCLYNNAVIDYAKTLWLPTPPKNIEKIIKSYTKSKVPHFFIYAKDKESSQVESANNSTMNRISSIIPNPRVKFSKAISKFDYRMMMNIDVDYTSKESPIIDEYNYWLKNWGKIVNLDDGYIDQDDLWAFNYVRNKILAYGDIDYIVNTLVAYCYTVKVNSNKKLLWSCFGDVIVKNLKVNTANLGRICPICGKRIDPVRGEQDIYCSQECFLEGERIKARQRKNK